MVKTNANTILWKGLRCTVSKPYVAYVGHTNVYYCRLTFYYRKCSIYGALAFGLCNSVPLIYFICAHTKETIVKRHGWLSLISHHVIQASRTRKLLILDHIVVPLSMSKKQAAWELPLCKTNRFPTRDSLKKIWKVKYKLISKLTFAFFVSCIWLCHLFTRVSDCW